MAPEGRAPASCSELGPSRSTDRRRLCSGVCGFRCQPPEAPTGDGQAPWASLPAPHVLCDVTGEQDTEVPGPAVLLKCRFLSVCVTRIGASRGFCSPGSGCLRNNLMSALSTPRTLKFEGQGPSSQRGVSFGRTASARVCQQKSVPK